MEFHRYIINDCCFHLFHIYLVFLLYPPGSSFPESHLDTGTDSHWPSLCNARHSYKGNSYIHPPQFHNGDQWSHPHKHKSNLLPNQCRWRHSSTARCTHWYLHKKVLHQMKNNWHIAQTLCYEFSAIICFPVYKHFVYNYCYNLSIAVFNFDWYCSR